MVKYPYQLQKLFAGQTVKDDQGNWVTTPSFYVNYCTCRDEDGNGKMITGTDGKQYAYSILIQMPRGVEALKTGDKIRIVDNAGNIRFTDLVILFSRKDQFHTRAWV